MRDTLIKKTLFVLSLFAAVAVASCGGGGGGGGVPPAAVQLAAVTLTGSQEVPAVTTTGSGNATVSVSADRTQIAFTVNFAGLSSATTLSHIHIGPPGVTGPVIVNFALVGGFTSPLTGTATAADFVPQAAQGINTFADAVNAILAGNTYINVHTVNNPTGEIRGALGPARLTATLSGAQEVPPVATAGTGTATINLNDLQTAIQFNVAFTGLSSATTLSHIHVGPVGVSGPVIVNFALAPFISPLTGTATAADFVPQAAQGVNAFTDAINAILSGNSYVNVHTVTNPTGEIRGQLAGVLAQAGAAPTADVFASIGNTTLAVAAPGLLANDPAGTTIVAETKTTSALGTVTVNATGGFTYEPAIGAQNVNDTFSYTATTPAGNVSVPVTINLAERAWYVMNNAAVGGDGSNNAPFTTLAAALGSSDAGDTIFVFAGDGTDLGQDAGITLQAGQKLIGEAIGLAVGGRVLVPAGAIAPIISNAGLVVGGPPVVALASNNEVAGIQLQADTNEGILGTGVANFNIHDNVINVTANTGREGIRLVNATGSGTIAGNTISGNEREGIDFTNVDVVVTPITATVRITGNTILNPGAQGQQGIAVVLDGLGTNVTMSISGNDVNGQNLEGIRIDSGPAGSVVKADVIGNTLDSLAQPDFRAQSLGLTSQICLELINNGNALGNATFTLSNAAGGQFEFFEPLAGDPLANDNPAASQVGVDIITLVPQGTCLVP